MPDYAQPSKPMGWDRALRDIHPRLSTVWNAPRRRWEIHYDADRGKGPQLAIVVGDGYNYEPLSDRVLQTLRKGDTHKIGPRAVAEIMDESERLAEEARERELDNMTSAMSQEMADHLSLRMKPIGVQTQKDWGKIAKPKYRESRLYSAEGKRIFYEE
jgi:hypothetical protein